MSENEHFPKEEKLSVSTLLSHGVAWLFAALGVALILYGICDL